MKIICVDNYDREMYDDILIAENVDERWGNHIVELLNNDYRKSNGDYFKFVENDYKLFKFEP